VRVVDYTWRIVFEGRRMEDLVVEGYRPRFQFTWGNDGAPVDGMATVGEVGMGHALETVVNVMDD
jgi:hypothetical protein